MPARGDPQRPAGARYAAGRHARAGGGTGLARNTVLYAYEQLASEGFVLPDRRGTVVAGSTGTARGIAGERRPGWLVAPRPAFAWPGGTGWNAALVYPADAMGAFAPGVPALDEFPLALWRRMLDRAWRALTPRQLNYGDPAGEPQLRLAIADHLRAARGVVCDAARCSSRMARRAASMCACAPLPIRAIPCGSSTPAMAARWRPAVAPACR
jgi:GntR family transcriptional regulator/MocR family aminotransferase